MAIIDFETFFWIPNTLYKAFGFDFLRTVAPRWKRQLLRLFMFFVIVSGFLCKLNMAMQLRSLMLMGDIFNGIRVANYMVFALDSIIKLLAFLLNVRRVRKIYDVLAAEYPSTWQQQQVYRVERHYFARSVRLLVAAYYATCFTLLMGALLQSLVMYAYELVRVGYAQAEFSYLRVIPMSYSFEYRTPLRYLAVYASEVANGYFSVLANMATDLWLSCFSAQICMHLEYVCRALEAYEPSVAHAREDCAFLIELIRKHQLMLHLHEELNAIFGISLVFNLLSTTAVLCVTTVQLSIEGVGFEFLKFLSFFILTTAQFFLICQRGQTLITLSENVAWAAYENRWYNASNAYKKLLLLIIIRAQKCAMLKAKGFHPLSLDTFKIVLSMTYRVFTVIQTMLN